MQRLHIDLLLGAYLYRWHGGARGCFGDSLRIVEIVLLRPAEGDHALRREELHSMIVGLKDPPPILRACADLQGDRADRMVRDELRDPGLPRMLPK